MVQQANPTTPAIVYPDCDGQPMADNTKQFRWIVVIKENLEICFADRPDVFVAGDLLWYPVEGQPKIRQAPDAMVVVGRPKGDRGSYKQWEEDQIAPQVVFEVLSPGNTAKEMAKKLLFYETYGVEEYYIYDPDAHGFHAWGRQGDRLTEIEETQGWVSPRLGIRFTLTAETFDIFYPDGRRFLTPIALDQLQQQESQRAEQERYRAEQERQRAEEAIAQLEAERLRYDALVERLRTQGIDPETLL